MKLKTKGWKIAFKNKKDDRYVVLKNNLNSWSADPFIFEKDGKIYIFAEIFSFKKCKGEIGYKVIENGKESKWKIIISEPYHLSFPNIYEDNDNLYMCAETNESGQLYRYECISFPDKWRKDIVYLSDRKLVDTVFFQYNNCKYGITLDIAKNKYDMLLFKFDGDKIVFDKNNPVTSDKAIARCGGNILNYGGKLIRVAQNCKRIYGEELIFLKIQNLSPYKEEFIKTISCKDINVKCSENFIGIHTYNESTNFQVIDLQYEKFEFCRFIIRIGNYFARRKKNEKNS